jgi:hypothetical protein
VALFGRKINNAEHQLTFVKYLRALADDEIEPAEAVRAYHADLAKLGLRPYRSLQDDLAATVTATSYSGASTPGTAPRRQRSAAPSPSPNGDPDFSKMTPAEKAQWNIERWKRIVG